MAFFEWLGETICPGKVGCIERHENKRQRAKVAVIFSGILSISAFLTPSFLVFMEFSANPNCIPATFMTLMITAIYTLIGYLFDFRPDGSNLGLLGGWMNDPFQISDDMNRTLLLARVVFFPGRIIAIGIADFFTAPFSA